MPDNNWSALAGNSAMFRILMIWLMLGHAASACAVPSGADAAAQSLLRWINAERTAVNLPAFRPSPALGQAARAHGCDMAGRGYFAHARPGGPTLGQRMKAAGYTFRAGNENLARTRRLDPAAVGAMWKASPPHRAALFDPQYRDIGLALAVSGRDILWVMVAAR